MCRNVLPKKTLAALKYEWKHTREAVMYSLPCRMILSLKAQEYVLSRVSPSSSVTFFFRKSKYFFYLASI